MLEVRHLMSVLFLPMKAKAKKPLFVQFVLDNVWAVYNAVVVQRLVFTFCVHDLFTQHSTSIPD